MTCMSFQHATAASMEGMINMNSQDELFRMRDGVETRWFSFENQKGLKGAAAKGGDGRKRAACTQLRAGESLTVAEIAGRSGVVRRMWFALFDGARPMYAQRPEILRGLRIDCFWDGAGNPAVSAPFGDFFCQGLGKAYAFDNALFSSPEGRSFVCTVPMPFRESMKLVVTNESAEDIPAFFYQVDCTLGDEIGGGHLYFHSHWRRENPTTEKQDFEFLPKVKGRGRFLGVNFSVIADKLYGKKWWGEGEVKIYLDGDRQYPTLCGTGTEDYIGTGWCQGKFNSPYCGCPYADAENMEYAFYRLHIPDPVYFHKNIRAAIQQIGGCPGEFPPEIVNARIKGSWGLFERHDDWSSCVYFYLDSPENGLPPPAPAAERIR